MSCLHLEGYNAISVQKEMSLHEPEIVNKLPNQDLCLSAYHTIPLCKLQTSEHHGDDPEFACGFSQDLPAKHVLLFFHHKIPHA